MEGYKETEKELRAQAIQAACRYYEFKHKNNKEFIPGDRIPYAGRVFDDKEIANLVDSSLDFWLTTGRYAEKFEKEFANFLGVQHCSLVNSGSSANLLAFMALTSRNWETDEFDGETRLSRWQPAFPLLWHRLSSMAQFRFLSMLPCRPTISMSPNLEAALSERPKRSCLLTPSATPSILQPCKAFL